jgi:hypothetical protein
MKACPPHSFLRTSTMKFTFYYCNRTAICPGSAGDSYYNIRLFLDGLVVISLEHKLMNAKHRF